MNILFNALILVIGLPIALAQWVFEGQATGGKCFLLFMVMFLIGSVYFFN